MKEQISNFLWKSTSMSWFWLVVRLYVGYEWIVAGWAKVTSEAWVGGGAGSALTGFLKGALAKTGGAHPDVQAWYATFLEHIILPHTTIWSNIVAWGEIAVGIGLILGILTSVAAFFGFFMNLNYLLAGTVSTNPILLMLSIGLMLAWRINGRIGLDHYFNFYRFTKSRVSPLSTHK